MIRSWFGGSRSTDHEEPPQPTENLSDDTGTFRPFPSSPSDAPRSAVSNLGFGGRGARTAQQDARMERQVSVAARNLGDGVQKIVIAAKTKQGGAEWKTDLLNLLGNAAASKDSKTKSDVDVLLENSKCEKFILRCVEAELPPNLIHCLRLVRVVELQNASQSAEGETDDEISPVALKATQKVTRLLCLLCKDSSVGEQLRPHLFGLLALSGASYPPSGVHVAAAASDVIAAVASHCLTRQLVWFIHDRKMILHMTDDIKELTGLTQAAGGAVPKCLTGHEAEKAGLWLIALKTVVQLLSSSCRFNTIDLVKDFEAAGGYEVLRFAIDHSTSPHGSKLVGLIPDLVCCPSRQPDDNFDEANLKLAANVRPMLLQEDLLHRSNPLWKEFQLEQPGKVPNLNSDGMLRRLAFMSIKKAASLLTLSDEEKSKSELNFQFDMSSALLHATLQVFSDHPDNYSILEGRQHILSFYLLSLPCYHDEDLQNFVLKTLEFVLTGVGVSEEVTPVNACVEIFFALCHVLIRNGDDVVLDVNEETRDRVLEALSKDAVLMGSTLEKLLQFDQRVAPLIIESGLMTTNLTNFLRLVAETNKREEGSMLLASTSVDSTFSTVCNVLKLLVAHQPVGFSKESDKNNENDDPTNLHTLLRMAVHLLGEDACRAASGVFESYLSSFASLDGLKMDMLFVLNIIEELANATKGTLSATALARQAMLVSLLRSVLESRSLARDAFRTCDGFPAILRVLMALEGSSIKGGDEVENISLLKLIEALVSLIDASVGIKSKNALSVSEVSPVIIPDNVVVDPSSSQLSSPDTPAPLNRNYIRQHTYYLDLAAVIAATGILRTDLRSRLIELAFNHVDPSLKPFAEKHEDVFAIRNPDAIRLVLGIAIFLGKEDGGSDLAEKAVDQLLLLTERKMSPTTLGQIASCGICWSLTSEEEFGPLLFTDGNPLQAKFVALLCSIASFGTSYMDFVGLLRRSAGPMLAKSGPEGRLIKIPVISSSLGRKQSTAAGLQEAKSEDSDLGSAREEEMVPRLRALRDIARYPDRFPRLVLGGDSINSIGVMMHQVKLEERLRAAAEEGRLRFVEVESVDSTALHTEESHHSDSSAYGSVEPIWYPLSSSGFSFSCWLRHGVAPASGVSGNLYIMDISSPNLAEFAAKGNSAFLGLWFDLQNQRFNVMSSASHRGEPICFPVSPLVPHVWHHILVTYTPGKRSMISRKSVFSIFVDGRPLEAEVKVDSVNLPPNARMIMGAPNPALAASGIVRGKLPLWEMGPCFLLSTVLLELDATAIYAYGTDFPGLLWGDRPERQSLSSTASCLFGALAEAGELGSVASALRRRDIAKMEGAGSNMTLHSENNDLGALNLYCTIPPEAVIFGYQPSTVRWKIKNDMVRQDRRLASERLANIARVGFCNSSVSTDAIVYGRGGLMSPLSLADSLRWAGGPNLLMPIINAAESSKTLTLCLQILRECCRRHQPNLEAMQGGGGFRILAVLLQEKGTINEQCLDQCMAFAIHGFEPVPSSNSSTPSNDEIRSLSHIHWVLTDLEAMKHVLLNHQVWDLRKFGPTLPLRLLSVLNRLVDHKSLHKAFNARRLHMVGIVRWGLHLMLEASELYTAGDTSLQLGETLPDSETNRSLDWVCEAPYVSDVSAGGDPGNPFLQACKNLLRRVLTFMLTPGDLEALSEALIYTVSSQGGSGSVQGKRASLVRAKNEKENDPRMLPASTARLYLVRLLEELIVDGVNEIVASASTAHESKGSGVPAVEHTVQPHAGGVASPNQPYLSTPALKAKAADGLFHPKHLQAQAFLGAFAGFLNPIWFATLLEGCREEASASAVVRLMVLMLQASTSFESSFRESGEFGPFVMSVPRFSTCPSIVISLLSQFFGVPILHIHSISSLDPENMCEVFDAEFENSGDEISGPASGDPANGIFALIAECAGRNLQLMTSNSTLEGKATAANRAILHLLVHRHLQSESFRRYCASPSFIEPFAQALCLLYTQTTGIVARHRRGSKLANVPKDITPTERFIGGADDADHRSFGFLQLLRQIIAHAFSLRGAARTIHSIFSSIPVHATPEEVKAFHLVLIEQCTITIEKLLDGDELLPLSNCVGILSVFLDQQVQGFSTTEAVLRIVQIAVKVLGTLTDRNATAWGSAGPEHSLVVADAAHIVRLICALSLRWSIDRADEDLLHAILELVESNIEMLLLVPSRERNVPVGPLPKVSPGSQLFPFWQSDSLSRCFPDRIASFPEISDSNKDADIAAIAPMIVSLHSLLSSQSEDLRSMAISVFVALLRHRETTMSSLLVAQFNRGGNHVETVDVVSRGGFRALLAAHEAAEMNKTAKAQSVKKRYASFFDWHEKNIDTVQLLFDNIEETALIKFPGLELSVLQQDEAVENEQKLIVTKITEQGSADQTILGGLRRADLSRRCAEKTAEYHGRWKRQGFDDLAFGAMKWKTLLRQMKGSHSIWEGGQVVARKKDLSLSAYLSLLKEKLEKNEKKREPEVLDFVVRWKLDLSEGYERQRRRLLPNYEFHGLYNLDEDAEFKNLSDDGQSSSGVDFLPGGGEMVATAELLKDLNLKRTSVQLDDFDENEIGDDSQTVATASTAHSGAESTADDTKTEDADGTEKEELTQPAAPDANEDSSSYELINGLLLAGDYPERSYNIRRCTGLEVAKALLLWCNEAIYIVDGFEQTIGEDMEPRINRVEKEKAIYNVALRQKNAGRDSTPSLSQGSKNSKRTVSRGKAPVGDQPTSEVIYQHRSKRISFDELYAVFRRRYQLQQNALEFFDTNKHGTLIAFDGNKEREEVLGKILQSKLPNSIFHSSYGTYISYAKVMANLKTKIETQWVNGKMSNFDFLMHLNSLAGRSFNDLTQYPVFPWVIADYDSEELDFDDPSMYRDLSKPMGALGAERAIQFRERYESLASSVQGEDDPPPFHYGTHYSTSAYVLHYLMRLEPFSRLALALQGGRFDVADRLFHDVGKSWRNASEDNLQDVRELIPEFYYLPEFLVNSNNFDFGETQKGKTIDDVTLPKWAKGDPYRFVRLNRKALESPLVSKHLHRWVDLIFGYKQRGEEAAAALNTFVHVTYEGEVDIDSMDDPIQRESTIAQIQNFGQTPKQLERRPFPAKNVVKAVKDNTIDFGCIPLLSPLTPPLCVAGAPHRIKIRLALSDSAKVGIVDQPDKAVGDLCYAKGQLVGTGSTCALLVGTKRYVRFAGLNNGISVHTAMISTRYREVDKLLSIHDGLHKAPICAVKGSDDGSWLVTGSIDSTLRVWHFDGDKLLPKATLCGHDGSPIKCMDVSTEFGMIVTGCAQGRVLLWDLRSLTFVRALRHDGEGASAISVSINNTNGNVVFLVGISLAVSDINGRIIATETLNPQIPPTCAVAADCPEWTDTGVVAVTGHMNGEIRLWRLDYDAAALTELLVVPENPHTNPISVLRLTGLERQDTLLSGDRSGKISVFKTVQLENMSPDELNQIIDEMSRGVILQRDES
ncbi:hypothetical protein ACA910_011004 [Epithemia clementina (nom. ined.)]